MARPARIDAHSERAQGVFYGAPLDARPRIVKVIDRYLEKFTFRSNHREMSNAMFDLLISAV
jgi:hypothetical protein